MFADDTDVAFGSHHWPTWGQARIVEYLAQQRDLYAYLHDQTLRLMNRGLTGIEIAEDFELPPALESAWHARGYYGSISHNVKGIYQRYLGRRTRPGATSTSRALRSCAVRSPHRASTSAAGWPPPSPISRSSTRSPSV